MYLKLIWLLTLAILVTLGSFASYLRLLMRRLTPVGARKVFQNGEEHRVRADRERVGVAISTLHGAAMAAFAVGIVGLFFALRPGHLWENIGPPLLIILGVIAFFDQLIPFLLVARHDEPEVILREWLPVLRACVYVALPLIFPILISTTINRLLEPEEENEQPPGSQENIQELIEAGEQEGLIERDQGEMLQSVVEFGDKVVREVMTPRPDIDAIEVNAPISELRKLFREQRHSRYPVFEGNLDNIVGLVAVRNLMELPPEEQEKTTLRALARPVEFVPETKRNAELLKELQQSTTQLAIVVDEYGAVAGLVTIEDLLEEIVGDIRDEVEPHDKDIVAEREGVYLVRGQTELAEVADELNVELEARDYSTVAGLVMSELGHVPAPGESLRKNGLLFEVVEATPRSVDKVRLSALSNGHANQAGSMNSEDP